MTPRDIALACLVPIVWGIAFVTTEFALESFSPSQLTALRFIIAALPIVFIRRPAVSWPLLITLGLLIFTGQFLLQFFAYDAGLSPGVASVIIHTQALLTILIAAVALREIPSKLQIAGLVVAAGGLLLVAASIGGDLTATGLGLALVAALSWAVGNVLLSKVGKIDMLALMFWLAAVPPLPSLAVSLAMGDDPGLIDAVMGATTESLLAVLYLGVISSSFAFAIWGRLLNTYKAAQVAPFALLAPCTGVMASYLIFGETFGPLRGAGMALIVAGVAATVLSGCGKSTRTNGRAP